MQGRYHKTHVVHTVAERALDIPHILAPSPSLGQMVAVVGETPAWVDRTGWELTLMGKVAKCGLVESMSSVTSELIDALLQAGPDWVTWALLVYPDRPLEFYAEAVASWSHARKHWGAKCALQWVSQIARAKGVRRGKVVRALLEARARLEKGGKNDE